MFALLFRALKEWLGMRRFQSLDASQRSIVFYAENGFSYSHFEPIIHSLTRDHNQQICYLTSSATDPIFENTNDKILAFNIGEGSIRTFLFKLIEAKVIVMTMPDLETYHIKRSPFTKQYLYIHHSLASTHMIYKKGAFDHFDTIFCVGPHHVEETRKTEVLYGLPKKTLFEHGYGKLDTLLKNTGPEATPAPATNPSSFRILIAPSWGPDALLETCGERLIQILLDAGSHITVRPHPQTRRLNGELLDDIRERFHTHPQFCWEEDIASQTSLIQSHLMISDWSGAALEYAFGLERPVLFVDIPRKVNNPEYERIAVEPIEVFIRTQIGRLLPVEQLEEAPVIVNEICLQPDKFKEQIRSARSEWVYNVGESGKKGAEYILKIISASN